MIIEFTGDDRHEKAAEVADPKHVWIDALRVVVYTGEDIPNDNE